MAGNEGKAAIGKSQLAISRAKNKPQRSKTKAPKKSKTSKTRAQQGSRRNDDELVTTFPEVKGKVIREVMFSHEDTENVLVIDFADRTALSFQIDPEPMVLPVDIRAHYLSNRQSADRRWGGLAGKGSSG